MEFIIIFFLVLKANLIPGFKEIIDPLACAYLKMGDVNIKEITIHLRKNKMFYSSITPFILTIKGQIENFEILSDVIKSVEENGNFYVYGDCTAEDEKAYLFLSFDTPYKIEEISGRKIKLKRVSKIKKVKVIKEREDETCESEEMLAKDTLFLGFGSEIKKVELTDYETDLPFIIIPFSDDLFPEIPDAPLFNSIEKRIVELINAERRLRGLKELVYSKEVSKVSRSHSENMAKNRFFSHFSPFTGSPSDRMKNAGIEFSKVSENIAMGDNADEIHALLMDSPAHKCNVLDPEMEKVGVGAYFHEDKWWVTENFIKERKKEDFALEKYCSILKEEGLAPLSDELFERIKSGKKITAEFLEFLVKKYKIPYPVQIQYLKGVSLSKIMEEIKKPCSIFYKKYGEDGFIIIIKR